MELEGSNLTHRNRLLNMITLLGGSTDGQLGLATEEELIKVAYHNVYMNAKQHYVKSYGVGYWNTIKSRLRKP